MIHFGTFNNIAQVLIFCSSPTGNDFFWEWYYPRRCRGLRWTSLTEIKERLRGNDLVVVARSLASFLNSRCCLKKPRFSRAEWVYLRDKMPLKFRSLETSDKQVRLFDRRAVASGFVYFHKIRPKYALFHL